MFNFRSRSVSQTRSVGERESTGTVVFPVDVFYSCRIVVLSELSLHVLIHPRHQRAISIVMRMRKLKISTVITTGPALPGGVVPELGVST